ncbi:TetR family transcriptional regulator [Paenibacillus chitinolyticus]|uniref:TetR family transcriptional regulator n=1 Tax=Paenibacillus chitinolyticus TaxID=79263 RepID=UPI002DB85FE4|nr:TetR family transcriptional regulator [Paenibacillus chitinolyticus]MEC0246549.1 TetR family transcriptional regulator [Paenibacillus chitinolyticus]
MSPKVNEEYKKQKKIALLQSAKQVFIRKGYNGATMQDIMEAAGVSRGALYAYFDNIEHVYLELLRHEDRKHEIYFRRDDRENCWQQVKNWLYKQQDEIGSMEENLVLANSQFFSSAQYRNNKDAYPYIAARYDGTLEVLTGFFEKGAAQGEFALRLPAETISRYLISFMDGLIMDTAHMGPEKTKVKEQLDALLFTLEAMLGPVQEKMETMEKENKEDVI